MIEGKNIGQYGPDMWIQVKVIVSRLAELYCTRRHSARMKWLFPASAYPPQQSTYVELLSVVVTHNLKGVWITADQEIKDLIRARGRVQASLMRIETFVRVRYTILDSTHVANAAAQHAWRCGRWRQLLRQ